MSTLPSGPAAARAVINRQNAAKSTGPISKRRASLNALRHGLTGQTSFCPMAIWPPTAPPSPNSLSSNPSVCCRARDRALPQTLLTPCRVGLRCALNDGRMPVRRLRLCPGSR